MGRHGLNLPHRKAAVDGTPTVVYDPPLGGITKVAIERAFRVPADWDWTRYAEFDLAIPPGSACPPAHQHSCYTQGAQPVLPVPATGLLTSPPQLLIPAAIPGTPGVSLDASGLRRNPSSTGRRCLRT